MNWVRTGNPFECRRCTACSSHRAIHAELFTHALHTDTNTGWTHTGDHEAVAGQSILSVDSLSQLQLKALR